MKEIKRLDKSHHEDFKKINAAVRQALTNKSWFMPISDENINRLFDDDSTLVVYGCFVDEKLGAVSLFDTNKEEFSQLSEALGIPDSKKGAELGMSMVLPDYRGQNLMLSINLELVKAAKEMGISYFVATAHPDNIASNTSIKKLGMEYKTTLTRPGGYIRNVYLMEF